MVVRVGPTKFFDKVQLWDTLVYILWSKPTIAAAVQNPNKARTFHPKRANARMVSSRR